MARVLGARHGEADVARSARDIEHVIVCADGSLLHHACQPRFISAEAGDGVEPLVLLRDGGEDVLHAFGRDLCRRFLAGGGIDGHAVLLLAYRTRPANPGAIIKLALNGPFVRHSSIAERATAPRARHEANTQAAVAAKRRPRAGEGGAASQPAQGASGKVTPIGQNVDESCFRKASTPVAASTPAPGPRALAHRFQGRRTSLGGNGRAPPGRSCRHYRRMPKAGA